MKKERALRTDATPNGGSAVTPRKIDIHDYDRKLHREEQLLATCGISDADQALIRGYWNSVFLGGMSKPRLIKEVSTVRLFAKRLQCGLKAATKEQLQGVIARIYQEPSYSVWTKADYANIVRKFYRWLEYGDAFRRTKDTPERVAWLTGSIKKKDKPKLRRSDLLTEQEAHTLIKTAGSPRDKALLALMWDAGARLGEIGNMTIANIHFADDGTYIDFNGKTGPRTVFLIESTQHLLHWISLHPARDNPHAPLWPISNNGLWNPNKPMEHRIIAQVIDRTANRAGITKRAYPHLFRHSRATWCATNGWNHLQMCKFFGWTLESDMPAYYTTLINKDVHEQMRKSYGLPTKNDDQAQRTPHTCSRCNTINPAHTTYCYQCGIALTTHAAQQAAQQRISMDHLMNTLVASPDALKDVLGALAKHGLLRQQPENLTQVKVPDVAAQHICSECKPTAAHH